MIRQARERNDDRVEGSVFEEVPQMRWIYSQVNPIALRCQNLQPLLHVILTQKSTPQERPGVRTPRERLSTDKTHAETPCRTSTLTERKQKEKNEEGKAERKREREDLRLPSLSSWLFSLHPSFCVGRLSLSSLSLSLSFGKEKERRGGWKN